MDWRRRAGRCRLNRRGFLGGLAAFAAACTLDPELALWKPGAKTISILKPAKRPLFVHGDIITIGGRFKLDSRTYKPTKELAQFVIIGEVTTECRFDLMPIWPNIIPGGQYQNVAVVRTQNEGKVTRWTPSMGPVFG